MSLGKKVFNSAALLFIRKIWGNLVNLGVMAFLARILSKEDFGLLAISSVFLLIINTVATSGIADYVVYYAKDDRDEKFNAAFWLNLLLTLSVVLVIVLSGPLWATFYNDKRIYIILLLLTIPFFFEMTSTIPKSILRKELNYKVIVFYSGIAMTAISIGKVVAAWSGLGMYSLVIPQAIVSPFLMIVFFVKARWMPRRDLGARNFKEIFGFSKHIIGGRILTRLVNDGDNLIVGKFIGLEALGVYSLAFQLANLVTTNVVFLVNDIFLPLFSKVRGDVDRLRTVYIRMIRFLSFISFPLITALAIVAESLVYYVYGEKWADVVLPFRILCIFALGRSMSSPSSSLFSAVGRPDVGFKFTAYFTPVFFVAVLLGSVYGVVGVSVSTTVVRVAGSVVSLYLSLSLIHLNLMTLFQLIKHNMIITVLTLILCSWAFINVLTMDYMVMLWLTPAIIYLYFLLLRCIYSRELVWLVEEVARFMPKQLVDRVASKLLFVKVK